MTITTETDETPRILADDELADCAQTLRAEAPECACDPVWRATLRAELVGDAPLVQYAPLSSPVGDVWVAFLGNQLRLISGREERDFVAMARHALGTVPVRVATVPARLARRVLAAIAGQRQSVAPEELTGLTEFQRTVLAQTQRIPRGEVRSYAWIAREIGHPQAVRAVGTALAHNPLPLVIPCHRVIRTDGELGTYSGGGALRKDAILMHEGVNLPHLQTLAQAGLRFQGSRTTKIFCLPTCYSGKHMQERNRVFFHSAAEAAQSGYRPCKLCHPA
jgi:O-6-methylguanine DNA methyltransferase